jgi:carboxyl-terminal processing protease
MQIISVFSNSPALESGVRVGDYIMYVGGGEDKVLVDAIGYTEALNRMLGEIGTKAEFTVFRPDKSKDIGYSEISFSIERRKVTSESVYYRVSETDSRVGIVNITGFDQTTAIQFCDAVDSLLAKGCEYFVFDVRNNPGGALASIEAVLSYFLDEGDLIVSTEAADGSKQEDFVSVRNYGKKYEGYNVTRSDIGKYKDLKSVVITNGNSASAAELFTATFRDYGIAKIVGEKTYGKGCMQTIIPLDKYGMEGGLRVTSAMYFSMSHTVYHGVGIEPDYPVSLSEEALEYNFFLLPEEKDDQLLTAIDVLTK